MKLMWAFLPVSLVACASGNVAGSDCTYPELPAWDCSPSLPPAAVGRTWQLSFSEEFEGSGYDATKLTPCFDWNYGGCTGSFNQGREYYAASQIRVSGGAAHLVAEPTSPPIMVDNSWQRSWNKGLLDSTLTRQLDVDYIRVFQQH